MLNPEISLPGAVVVSIIAIGAVSYAVAPEVGRRLAHGAVAACEKGLLQELAVAAKKESDAIEIPATPEIDLGAAIGVLLGGRPGSDAYMERYGSQFEGLGEAITAPMRQQAERARKAAARKLENIQHHFRERASAGASECECRAIAAVNKGHTALAVFTATGGLVAWSPAGNFPAAIMSDPEVVAQCKGVS